MEPYVKAPNTKRFVVEDSITKVTSDGEPHGMMTMIAGLSGLLAAIAILAVLISLVACKKTKQPHNCEKCPPSPNTLKSHPGALSDTNGTDSPRSSVSTAYRRCSSIAEDIEVDVLPRTSVASVSGFVSSGNFEGNLNSAFEGGEMNLIGSSNKNKKRAHWSDESTANTSTAKETRIDVERY